MGDVDVVYHQGVYHLFHLVLPNHDFIAHAISDDGLNWRRIENALFIGHPGNWDDHMLWTMHVSLDPWRPGCWRMFYTGLSREERGDVQRIGIARSKDLVHWTKVTDRIACRSGPADAAFAEPTRSTDEKTLGPIAAAPPHYESSLDEGRSWVSFRDPFYFRDGKRGLLLMAARTPKGPVIRRGCVGIAEETSPDQFRLLPPLHHPGQYDDIEVPNLFQLDSRYYLVGSIREDAKIRYWFSDQLQGPWHNFFDNVLLAGGNYAARVSFDHRGPLVWNFFTSESQRTVNNLMPPPKRLAVGPDGRLRSKSFEAFDTLCRSRGTLSDLLPMTTVLDNPDTSYEVDQAQKALSLKSVAGFQGFLFAPSVSCFRFSAKLFLEGLGKCGMLFRMHPATSSGYHLSLDLLKGVAQLRAWGARPGGRTETAFRFHSLQAGYWRADQSRSWEISLLALGPYLEFSVDGHVLLTLSDETYARGRFGCYVESARLRMEQIALEHLASPSEPSDRLANG